MAAPVTGTGAGPAPARAGPRRSCTRRHTTAGIKRYQTAECGLRARPGRLPLAGSFDRSLISEPNQMSSSPPPPQPASTASIVMLDHHSSSPTFICIC